MKLLENFVLQMKNITTKLAAHPSPGISTSFMMQSLYDIKLKLGLETALEVSEHICQELSKCERRMKKKVPLLLKIICYAMSLGK